MTKVENGLLSDVNSRFQSAKCDGAMLKPPPTIDNARVIAYAILDPAVHQDLGKLRLFSGGALQTWFHGVAVATYDQNRGEIYVFFCDADWETENDTVHRSIDDALDTVRRKFGVLNDHWQWISKE